MKHAWLIIAHNEWGVMQRLVSELDAPECDFFVHIDKKVKVLPDLNIERGRLFMLENRVDVRWGSVSQIQCEMTLFEAAAANGPYDYYHVISGVTLPLKPLGELDAFFQAAEGKSVLTGLRVDEPYQENLKVHRRHYFLRHYCSRNRLVRWTSQHLWSLCLAYQRKRGMEVNQALSFYKASNWISLTEEAVQYILGRKDKIWDVFQRSFCGDEFFVPSELMASPLKDRILSHEQYLLQKMGRATTTAFPLEEYESMRASGYLFARKFTEKVTKK